MGGLLAVDAPGNVIWGAGVKGLRGSDSENRCGKKIGEWNNFRGSLAYEGEDTVRSVACCSETGPGERLSKLQEALSGGNEQPSQSEK